MSSNETSTILMIELLSLAHKLTGYQIEVDLIREIGSERCILTIDEFTYIQLNMLGPFTEERVRLSLYPKWDPFRNVHYSSLIKMNKNFSETLYFVCSKYYVSQLLELKQEEQSQSKTEMVYQAELSSVGAPLLKPCGIQRMGHAGLRRIIFSFLLILCTLRMDGNLFVDNADALENPTIKASSKETFIVPLLPLVHTTAIMQNKQDQPSEDVTEPPQEKTPMYDEIEIDSNKYEYSLPEDYVALTFDDGPSQYTKEIVDILVEHEVAATFLFIGNKVLRYPEEVSYTNQHDMSIGSHSWDHSEMTKNSDKENRENLTKANKALEQIIQAPITIFRPPYGSINDRLANLVTKKQMKVLQWNRDPMDWNAKNPEEIMDYFHKSDPTGGLYLLHERKMTVEVLPEIIEYLKEQNLKFAIFK
ncbi:peptidoglycan/xylan/chitin deacetylase (PgdA/CDA1 family) [Paenibacillus sp. DS2015]|uniref:polysaccharide deacetylase family protein n=1 Tax=Paenibacillus sp. DS2015 TaxID=3373917 RepID=UPI003D1B8B7A